MLSGLSAVKLAEQSEYDLLGRALLTLGAAHAAMQQFEQALSCFQRYFTYRAYCPDRGPAGGRAAWKSLGITYQRMLQPKQAVPWTTRTWFGGRQMEHGVFTTTHDLINVYLYLAKKTAACGGRSGGCSWHGAGLRPGVPDRAVLRRHLSAGPRRLAGQRRLLRTGGGGSRARPVRPSR